MKIPEAVARNLTTQIVRRLREVPEFGIVWEILSRTGKSDILKHVREDVALMLTRAIEAAQSETTPDPDREKVRAESAAVRMEFARLAHENQCQRTERHRLTRARQSCVRDAWVRLRRLNEGEADAFLRGTAMALRVDPTWLLEQWEQS